MKKFAVLGVILWLSLAIVPVASATVLTFDLCFEFSGATPPAGSTPWLRATFDDFGGNGSVQLTMEAMGLTGQEFVSNWAFNLNPALDSSGLLVAVAGPVGATVVTTGSNNFKADGDGFYDLVFDFPPPPGNFASKFTSGESVVATLSMTGLTANDFNFLSENSNTTSWHTAAHVQGIGPNGEDSGWVGDCPPIPEPGTLALLGLGLVGSGLVRRRRRA